MVSVQILVPFGNFGGDSVVDTSRPMWMVLAAKGIRKSSSIATSRQPFPSILFFGATFLFHRKADHHSSFTVCLFVGVQIPVVVGTGTGRSFPVDRWIVMISVFCMYLLVFQVVVDRITITDVIPFVTQSSHVSSPFCFRLPETSSSRVPRVPGTYRMSTFNVPLPSEQRARLRRPSGSVLLSMPVPGGIRIVETSLIASSLLQELSSRFATLQLRRETAS